MAQLKTPYRNREENIYYTIIIISTCTIAIKPQPNAFLVILSKHAIHKKRLYIYDAAAAPVHTTQSTTLNIIIKVSNLIFIYFSQTNIESFASLLQAFKKDYIEHKSDKWIMHQDWCLYLKTAPAKLPACKIRCRNQYILCCHLRPTTAVRQHWPFRIVPQVLP